MFAILVALALTQAPAEPAAPVLPPDAPAAEQPLTPPPPPSDAAPLQEFRPNTLGRKAGFFSAPRVDPGILVARVGMGMALGSTLGGGVAAAFLGFAGLLAALSSSAVPLIIAAPFAIAALGVGTALGAAMFGEDYGRDLADAVGIALVTSAISVIGGITLAFLLPVGVATALVIGVGLVFPAISTPLFVQAFKPDDGPLPAIALASF